VYTGGSLSDHTIFNKNKGGKVYLYIKREYLIQSFPCLFFCFFFYRDLLAPFLTCIDWQIDMQNSAMSTLISKEEKNQQPKIQQFSQ
jgi:hypothetical protein